MHIFIIIFTLEEGMDAKVTAIQDKIQLIEMSGQQEPSQFYWKSFKRRMVGRHWQKSKIYSTLCKLLEMFCFCAFAIKFRKIAIMTKNIFYTKSKELVDTDSKQCSSKVIGKFFLFCTFFKCFALSFSYEHFEKLASTIGARNSYLCWANSEDTHYEIIT